jgi:hypothetical protein
MALFNEILAGRFNRFLQKHLSMKGPPPAAQLAGEIVPAVDFVTGVESFLHQGWQKYGVYFTRAAVAAQNSAAEIRNPKTSGVIVVIESIVFATVQGVAVCYSTNSGPLTTDLATSVVPTFARWDGRGGLNPSAILSVGNNATGISAPNKHVCCLAANTAIELINHGDQELPISPGDALQLLTLTLNVNLDVGVQWRERPLEDSELAL